MGPVDTFIYMTNQPSGQKGNKVDLISQEKKNSKKTPNTKLKNPPHISKLPK